MKNVILTDRDGNPITFRVHESQIFNDDGTSIVDKLNTMNTAISSNYSTLKKNIDDNYTSSQEGLSSHVQNTDNPHSVNKTQVGLGNVENLAFNDNTVKLTDNTLEDITNFSTGDKVSSVFGRISTAIKSLKSHLSNTTYHITAAERTAWNEKAASSHKHSAADITSGTLGVARGGTGATSVAGILSALGLTGISDSKMTITKSSDGYTLLIRFDNGIQIYTTRDVYTLGGDSGENVSLLKISFSSDTKFKYAPMCFGNVHTKSPDKSHVSITDTSAEGFTIATTFNSKSTIDLTISALAIGFWK